MSANHPQDHDWFTKTLCFFGLHNWKSIQRWHGDGWYYEGWEQCRFCRTKRDRDEQMYRATEYYR